VRESLPPPTRPTPNPGSAPTQSTSR
jgi:hypothetical protein